MGEKRGYERLAVSAEAILKTLDGAASLHKGYLEDISFGGFRVALKEKMEPETPVSFEFNLPLAGESLYGKGIIKYVTEQTKYNSKTFLTGVAFTEVNKDILTYGIKKIQAKIAQQKRSGGQDYAAGFIPY